MAEIAQKILTTNNCYKAGVTRKVTEGLMVHSVGCNQPSADVFVSLWAKNANTVCPNGLVDATHIYQLLPWNMKAWHACDPANSTYLGVETTEPSTITYNKNGSVTDRDPVASKKHIDAVYANTVQLFAYLCKMYGFDPLEKGRILSHAEGAKLGIASKHGDPDHLWPRYGYTMDGFRQDVKKAMGMVPTPAPVPPAPAPKKDIDTIAREVIQGKWSAGAERAKLLVEAGYDYIAVQKRVNEILSGSTPKKSIDEVAMEVIQGKWGAGEDRKKRLTAAGYDYNTVQKRVNEILAGSSSKPTKDIDTVAMEVIQGKWGVGEDRKKRLTAAGYDYNAVQKRVNELLKTM